MYEYILRRAGSTISIEGLSDNPSAHTVTQFRSSAHNRKSVKSYSHMQM
jgi:hypothetical protein